MLKNGKTANRNMYENRKPEVFRCKNRKTDTFLMAHFSLFLRRFASLRGHPSTCWSDCGTNFVGAQHYLKEVIQNWDIPRIQSVLSEEFSCSFQWEWNVPRASHQNGVVESLIKSVRQALDASSKNHSFTEEQWRTYLAEVSYLVNSRPLYPSSDEIWESPPITPNDLLIGHHFPPPAPEQNQTVNPRHWGKSISHSMQTKNLVSMLLACESGVKSSEGV